MADALAVLRIYSSEDDTWHGRGLHSALIDEARKSGLAGATVLRGIEGFGVHQRIHRSGFVDFSPDLPMVVEIVDSETALRSFAAACAPMIGPHLVTLQQVERVIATTPDQGAL
jgi:PII-like signaling protein